MSDNTKVQPKKKIKYYEYKHFRNIEKIGIVEIIIHELELQREVDFHNTVIRLYGITVKEENQNCQLKKYLLISEYADSNSLRSYLKETFTNLTWDDKYKLAYQLVACVISSEQPPFKDKSYDVDLNMQILQGFRETIVLNTPVDYSNLYIDTNVNSSNIQIFYKMGIKEMKPTIQNIHENIFEEDLSIIINELDLGNWC
ncbi:hypothetical protein C1645_841456 [Glomus cerebriforme]|uniref:Protein kinase domain-containing protein n=1 Tax=Glomus cerebriforme TaxID=658196 RepID=A0A397S8S9_9GLOM|nr:hypothetical protein C1645_841456 [Glomus cerebriforme]